MNVDFTEYDPSTGELIAVYSVPEEDLPVYSDIPQIEGRLDGAAQYYDLRTGEISNRPLMPLSLKERSVSMTTTETLRIRGIPIGTSFTVGTLSGRIDDGSLDFASPIPLRTTLSLTNFPYVPVEIELEVVPNEADLQPDA